MNRRLLALVAALATLAVLPLALEVLRPTEAEALPPLKNYDWDRYIAPANPKGHSVVVGTTQALVYTTAGGSYTDERDAQLFNWGDLIVIQCPLEACACFTMEDEIAVVTMGSGTTCGNMTDSGTPADGQGACFRIPADGRRDIRLNKAWFGSGITTSSSLPGHRDGYCSNTTGTTGYPCDANADCVTGAGAAGTCVTQSPDKILGAFMLMEAASATNCSVEVER